MSEVQAPAAAPEPKKRDAATLVEARIGLVEHRRQDWVAIADESHTLDDVMDPMYWAHVSGRFQQYDRIEVRQESGEWIVDLILVEVGRNYARVIVAAKHDLRGLESLAPAAAVKHKVERKGDHKKWCVIRIADNALIQEGMLTKAQAEEWLANHERLH